MSEGKKERHRQKIMQFDIFVEKYTNTEESDGDKPDKFVAHMVSDDKDFKIGLQDAKAAITVTSEDDIIKRLLENGHKYRCIITEYYESVFTPQVETSPTTLEDHCNGDKPIGEQEKCGDCSLPVSLCMCDQGDGAATVGTEDDKEESIDVAEAEKTIPKEEAQENADLNKEEEEAEKEAES